MSTTLSDLTAKTVTPLMDCQIWQGTQTEKGYGRAYIDGKSWRIHRLAWELRHGPIPEGLTIDHLCLVRACINTDHMELVTSEENAKRAKERDAYSGPLGLRAYPADGQCVNGHELPAPPSGRCVQCRRENDLKHRPLRRARERERRREARLALAT